MYLLQKAWLACSEIKMPHRLTESIDHCCTITFNASDKSRDEGPKVCEYITQVAGLVILELHVPVILMLLLYIILTAIGERTSYT